MYQPTHRCIDTNRLYSSRVRSDTARKNSNAIVDVDADSKSGFLKVREVVRDNEKNATEDQLPISELLWGCWLHETFLRDVSPDALRIIWIDYILHEATRTVV
ncbi:hypothetical protein NXS19_008532 [Fusarium pseudograminearum]|nr:hypothetical protein NXS19_008532 [Fusarium pseudograminearum]